MSQIVMFYQSLPHLQKIFITFIKDYFCVDVGTIFKPILKIHYNSTYPFYKEAFLNRRDKYHTFTFIFATASGNVVLSILSIQIHISNTISE